MRSTQEPYRQRTRSLFPSRFPPSRRSQGNPSKRARRQRRPKAEISRISERQRDVWLRLRKACVPSFSELGFRTQARRSLHDTQARLGSGVSLFVCEFVHL